jgi:hypothetical protein
LQTAAQEQAWLPELRVCGCDANNELDYADFCEDPWSILLLSAPSPDPRLMLSAGNATKVLRDLDQDHAYIL